MVIWIIGLSGSGKSFLANKIYKDLNKKRKKVICIDGDEIRKYITYDLKYSIKDRRKNSKLISDLCKLLEKKGYIVICSILSIFKDHQKKNRKKFKKYVQVYINSDLKKLKKANTNKVYKSKKNVVGKDIKFPIPYKSDFVIERDNKKKYLAAFQKIISMIK
tara:strand:- start:156 stop:641 length:486 start_codon:yes stop_codon:yes gene_type:complete